MKVGPLRSIILTDLHPEATTYPRMEPPAPGPAPRLVTIDPATYWRSDPGGGPSMAPGDIEPLMTAKQVGEWLGYSADTVFRYARTEGLPCVRMAGRKLKFRRAAVQA